jgi:hypothetical protein
MRLQQADTTTDSVNCQATNMTKLHQLQAMPHCALFALAKGGNNGEIRSRAM